MSRYWTRKICEKIKLRNLMFSFILDNQRASNYQIYSLSKSRIQYYRINLLMLPSFVWNNENKIVSDKGAHFLGNFWLQDISGGWLSIMAEHIILLRWWANWLGILFIHRATAPSHWVPASDNETQWLMLVLHYLASCDLSPQLLMTSAHWI